MKVIERHNQIYMVNPFWKGYSKYVLGNESEWETHKLESYMWSYLQRAWNHINRLKYSILKMVKKCNTNIKGIKIKGIIVKNIASEDLSTSILHRSNWENNYTLKDLISMYIIALIYTYMLNFLY